MREKIGVIFLVIFGIGICVISMIIRSSEQLSWPVIILISLCLGLFIAGIWLVFEEPTIEVIGEELEPEPGIVDDDFLIRLWQEERNSEFRRV